MRSAEAIAAFWRAKALAASAGLLGRFGARPPDPSEPVVERETYRRCFAAWNDLGLDLDAARSLARAEAAGRPTGHPGLVFGLSTGTLGEPGVFIASASDRARWLGTFLAHALTLREVASFLAGGRAAVLLRHDSALYHQTGGRTRFLALGAGEDAVLRGLLDARPDVVVGPPMALRRIAERAEARGVVVAARLALTGGEPLWPEDAAAIARGLGAAGRTAAVRQVYQAAEGFFGAGCRCGGLHLAADAVAFERVDFAAAPDRFVPVVTDPARRGPQRLRRYRTDDVAVAAPDTSPCRCGSVLPVVEAIEGRLADVLSGRSGEPLFPRRLHAVLAPHLDGSPFRVEQAAADRLSLALPARVAAAAARRAAAALAEAAGLPVETSPLAAGPLDAKFRRFVRSYPAEPGLVEGWLRPPVALSIAARKASAGR